MFKAVAMLMVMMMFGTVNASTLPSSNDVISVESIKLGISPNYGPALGSIYQIELSIDSEQCLARIIQLTSYCTFGEGEPSIQEYVYHEQVGNTPDDAFELFSKQALREIAAHDARDWVESSVQDGDITSLTIHVADGLFIISGVNADEYGPPWYVSLCDQMKHIMKDSGIDLDEVFRLYGRR